MQIDKFPMAITPIFSKRTLRTTYNVWGYARPYVPFGVDSFIDGIANGDIFVIQFSRSINDREYGIVESWIDDHLTGNVFYLLNSKVFFDNNHDAVTFKMLYALTHNLLD